jgi:hypothetical protein
MARGFVLNPNLGAQDRARLNALLLRAGFDPVYQFPAELTDIDPKVDVGVVCLPGSADDQAILEERVGAFVSAGIRVITIWLTDEGVLPEIFRKFGSAAVSINSPKAVDALKGEPAWEEASGAGRTTQPLTRNKCR